MNSLQTALALLSLGAAFRGAAVCWLANNCEACHIAGSQWLLVAWAVVLAALTICETKRGK